jgi:mRNA degradation ribonuclease J1/J2
VEIAKDISGSEKASAAKKVSTTVEDITWVIDQIDPDHIIPIHTDSRDWFARSFENMVLVEEGKQYKL